MLTKAAEERGGNEAREGSHIPLPGRMLGHTLSVSRNYQRIVEKRHTCFTLTTERGREREGERGVKACILPHVPCKGLALHPCTLTTHANKLPTPAPHSD